MDINGCQLPFVSASSRLTFVLQRSYYFSSLADYHTVQVSAVSLLHQGQFSSVDLGAKEVYGYLYLVKVLCEFLFDLDS